MSFPCTRCGLCCKNISEVPGLENYDNGSGVCVHYSQEAGCLVYDDRPLVCRVDDGFPFVSKKITLQEYYRENARVCNKLQEDAGFPKVYRVHL